MHVDVIHVLRCYTSASEQYDTVALTLIQRNVYVNVRVTHIVLNGYIIYLLCAIYCR